MTYVLFVRVDKDVVVLRTHRHTHKDHHKSPNRFRLRKSLSWRVDTRKHEPILPSEGQLTSDLPGPDFHFQRQNVGREKKRQITNGRSYQRTQRVVDTRYRGTVSQVVQPVCCSCFQVPFTFGIKQKRMMWWGAGCALLIGRSAHNECYSACCSIDFVLNIGLLQVPL